MVDHKKVSLDILRWLVLPVLLVIATSGFVAAQSGFPRTENALIADYQVEQIQYRLDPDNPAAFSSVSFNLRGPADQASIGLDDSAGSVEWAACRPGLESDFICDLRGLSIPVDQAVKVHISASY
jgi:hypothetical protein